MTCGNCHTPKGPPAAIAGKDFSGGLSWDEPPFKVTAPNITPDKDTGIGKWTDAEIKKVLRTGETAERRACRDGDADRLLSHHDRARPRRGRRLSAHAQAGQQQGGGPDLQDAAGRARPARRREALRRSHDERQGEEGLLSRHHRALHGVPHADGQGRAPVGHASRAPAVSTSPGPGASRPRATSPRARPRASAPGPTTRSSAPSPRASARTAASSSRRWASSITPR